MPKTQWGLSGRYRPSAGLLQLGVLVDATYGRGVPRGMMPFEDHEDKYEDDNEYNE